jgi:hypothetical protein
MKICGKCNIEKQNDEFTFRKDVGRYESQCKQCIKDYLKYYYENNRSKIISRNKKNYYENQSEKIEYAKKYRLENCENRNKYEKIKRETDCLYKLKQNVRNRINKYVKKNNINKNNKTFELVGTEPSYLKEYLEKKFTQGMTWNNYGDWHVDHIIPLSLARNEKDIAKLCHYTNLQPLWAKDNLIKGNKII